MRGDDSTLGYEIVCFDTRQKGQKRGGPISGTNGQIHEAMTNSGLEGSDERCESEHGNGAGKPAYGPERRDLGMIWWGKSEEKLGSCQLERGGIIYGKEEARFKKQSNGIRGGMISQRERCGHLTDLKASSKRTHLLRGKIQRKALGATLIRKKYKYRKKTNSYNNQEGRELKPSVKERSRPFQRAGRERNQLLQRVKGEGEFAKHPACRYTRGGGKRTFELTH